MIEVMFLSSATKSDSFKMKKKNKCMTVLVFQALLHSTDREEFR